MRRLVTTSLYRTQEDLGIPENADLIGTEVNSDLETTNVWVYQASQENTIYLWVAEERLGNYYVDKFEYVSSKEHGPALVEQ